MAEEKTKVLIIGSGPAGYTAGIYTSRANLHPVIYEGPVPGGQLTQTTEIENFPGYPEGITGQAMMDDLRKQAARFGAELRADIISKVDFSKRPFRCEDDHGNVIIAETVIVSTGASARYLGISDEEKYRGLGVSACATCDGFFYRKQDVAVVGGGDTACEEALYLSTLARKVYLIVRKDYLRASKVMKKRVEERENIEILYNCNTKGLFGEDGVEGAHIVRHLGTDKEEDFDIAITGFFLAIGHKPATDLFRGQLELDNEGYIKVKGATSHTSVEGVFAAGDVADPRYRQAITAAGSGCRAALDAERFLMEH
ncbi:MAG: thioredoxin-disulfide reductase [Muribaculaceae bacterium]|nr:thioredoxin-disulfide reductase [Muribaculaceae bacterium]MCI5627926.1 thioredoxin-disulfide reductase [Porphyromonadaceae bacterium]MDD6313781.1 thioredoxin-disulfide reductase [Porphyromonadaceae bacterium]